MSLVDYSDSEEDAETTKDSFHDKSEESFARHEFRKRKREADDDSAKPVTMPPPVLPSNFHNLYATNVRSSTADDPALHNGRQRLVPHVVGNWPSFIYLEWLPAEEELVCLQEVVSQASGQLRNDGKSDADIILHSSLRSELGVRLPLHISLSSHLTLTTDNKDSFQQELTRAVESARISSFSVMPTGVRWVGNFDKSRYFLVLTLSKPDQDQLRALLSVCNDVARCFSLPELYVKGDKTDDGIVHQELSRAGMTGIVSPPPAGDKFHISIAWSLAPPEETDLEIEAGTVQNLRSIAIYFEKLLIKVGNQISAVRLTAS